jgi:drug/metabolite transporter (DMT)-like permease
MRPADLFQLLMLACAWGGAYLFMRAAVPAFGAAPMVFLRLAMGSLLVLLPLTLWKFGPGPLIRHWKPLLIYGTLFTAVPFIGLGWSARSISAGLLAVLQSAAPLFSALIARWWTKEPITPMRAAGLVIGFAGVTLLVWDQIGVRSDAGLAIIVTLLVTVLWGVSSNYARTLHDVDPIVLATGSIGIGALVLAPSAMMNWPQQAPGLRAWAEVTFMGIVASGCGFLLYFGLIRRIGAVRATSVSFLTPVVTMILGALYLGEALTLRMITACAVIIVGTALTLDLVPRLSKRAKG